MGYQWRKDVFCENLDFVCRERQELLEAFVDESVVSVLIILQITLAGIDFFYIFFSADSMPYCLPC
jgi:hypothetical protein